MTDTFSTTSTRITQELFNLYSTLYKKTFITRLPTNYKYTYDQFMGEL
jgi:hypothetical protein